MKQNQRYNLLLLDAKPTLTPELIYLVSIFLNSWLIPNNKGVMDIDHYAFVIHTLLQPVIMTPCNALRTHCFCYS